MSESLGLTSKCLLIRAFLTVATLHKLLFQVKSYTLDVQMHHFLSKLASTNAIIFSSQALWHRLCFGCPDALFLSKSALTDAMQLSFYWLEELQHPAALQVLPNHQIVVEFFFLLLKYQIESKPNAVMLSTFTFNSI